MLLREADNVVRLPQCRRLLDQREPPRRRRGSRGRTVGHQAHHALEIAVDVQLAIGVGLGKLEEGVGQNPPDRSPVMDRDANHILTRGRPAHDFLAIPEDHHQRRISDHFEQPLQQPFLERGARSAAGGSRQSSDGGSALGDRGLSDALVEPSRAGVASSTETGKSPLLHQVVCQAIDTRSRSVRRTDCPDSLFPGYRNCLQITGRVGCVQYLLSRRRAVNSRQLRITGSIARPARSCRTAPSGNQHGGAVDPIFLEVDQGPIGVRQRISRHVGPKRDCSRFGQQFPAILPGIRRDGADILLVEERACVVEGGDFDM